MNSEFLIKKSILLDILTLVKSKLSPQNDPKIFKPPAFDSDSLELSKLIIMGMTKCLSFKKN